MLSPSELRDDARFTRATAARETDPILKRAFALRALALSQLAEKLEREAKQD
jgi:hypothetical protein